MLVSSRTGIRPQFVYAAVVAALMGAGYVTWRVVEDRESAAAARAVALAGRQLRTAPLPVDVRAAAFEGCDEREEVCLSAAMAPPEAVDAAGAHLRGLGYAMGEKSCHTGRVLAACHLEGRRADVAVLVTAVPLDVKSTVTRSGISILLAPSG